MEAWKEELYHFGIKGQKWGERHYQNPDGTFTEAGKQRYFKNGSGENYVPVKRTKAEKKAIRKEYRAQQKERNKELERINAKYDAKQTENTWGLESGGVSDRIKNHIKNEYARQKEINKWDQKNLDARRQHRMDMGKKKVDTLMMKWQQDAINDISQQSQTDFTKDYVKYMASHAVDSLKGLKNRGGDD